jgi:hypothetical protein
MPGFSFASNFVNGWNAPTIQRYFVAQSLTGNNTSTTPGAAYAGDLIVATSSATWGTNTLYATNVNTLRPLLYKDNVTSTLSGGILGICTENFTTDSNGRFNSVPTYGLPQTPIPFAVPNPSSLWFQDPVAFRNQLPVILAGRGNALKARITPLYTAASMGPNLIGTTAGIGLATGLSAPALTQGTTLTTSGSGGNGTLAASTEYYVVVTYLNAIGQTNVSNVINATTTTGTTNTLTVVGTSGVLNSGQVGLTNIATGYGVYASSSATGPFYLQNAATGTALGTSFTFGTSGNPYLTSGTLPVTANTTGSPGVTQYWIDPGATTKCFDILELNTADPNYGATFTSGNLTPGPECILTVIPTYAVLDPGYTGTIYTY